MNKLYAIVLCSSALVASSAIAQPTLTQANNVPQVGENFVIHSIDYTSPGNGGANVTWDFSNLTSNGTSNVNWITPGSTPNGGSFPGASASYETGQGNYYYIKSSSARQEVGGFDNSGTILNYSDPETVVEYPITHNGSWSDNMACTFVSNGITFVRTGGNTGVADGYGTLILPYGTFNNVLRVTVTQDYQDDYDIGVPATVEYDAVNTYWYLPGTHSALLQLSSLTTTSFGQPTTAEYGFYLDQTSVGIENYTPNQLFAMHVFPNPTSSSSNLYYTLKDGGNVFIALYNTLGQEVQTVVNQSQTTGDYTTTINVDDLGKGIYIIRMEVDGQVQTQKLTVQ